jgi:hypothetical protein
MKKLLLSICLAFLLFDTISQNVNYIPYYKWLCKARIAHYCQNNCDSAIDYYTRAFEMVDYILINDLRDFTQCAIDIDNDSLVFFAMERCNKQTIPLAFIFPSDSISEKYKNTDQWNTCMSYEKQNHEIYTKKYHCPYKRVLDSLRVKDQKVRKEWTCFCRIFHNSKIAKKRMREWFITDSCNQRVVDDMIQKYGFPNERIGCPNDYLFYQGGGGVVLIHYDNIDFFRNVEYKALLEGKLAPECYARRAARMATIFEWDKLQYTYSYSKRRGKKMTLQEKEQVDKNRYEIGLPSVEDERIINRRKYQIYKARQNKSQ